MTEIAIRPMVAEDLESVLAIEGRADQRFLDIGATWIAVDDWPTREDLLGYLMADRAWVVEMAGAIRGEVLVSVLDGHAHVDQLTVDYDWGGQGLGSALLRQAEAWAVARGDEAITLTTSVEVPWNMPWYQRVGYRVLAADERGPELAAHYDYERRFFGESPAVTMSKDLN